jgi:hypothetical protein
MKNILVILFMSVFTFGFSQKEISIDTNNICIPSNVAKEILQELNKLDRLKEEKLLSDKEIVELEKKIKSQNLNIKDLEEKDLNNKILISANKEKYILIEEDNKNLRNEIKNVKTKNTIIEIVSGLFFATITYIQITK